MLGFPEVAILLVTLFIAALEVLMFVDIILNKNLSDLVRVLWVLSLVFFPVVSAVVYYVIVYNGKFAIGKRQHLGA